MFANNWLIKLTTLLSFIFLSALVFAAESAAVSTEQQPWLLKQDKDGIKIFTRAVPGSAHQAVKAEMVIESTLNALVGLIRDTQACSQWAELCKEAREHEVISDQELYVYSFNDIPWPIKDRDALTHVLWDQDIETGQVTMVATATDGIFPEVKNAVRIVEANTRWTLTPQADGKVSIVSYAHVNPNGPTPAWVTNLLLVETPFKTLQGMRRLVETGRYNDAQFDFLKSS